MLIYNLFTLLYVTWRISTGKGNWGRVQRKEAVCHFDIVCRVHVKQKMASYESNTVSTAATNF